MKPKTPPIKKTKQTETKIRLEHISIVENGVRVDILVDYQAMTVSLVDPNRDKKNYMFCGRGLSYEAGWNHIIEAMNIAMKIGFDKLRERQDANEAEKIEMYMELENQLG